MNNGPIMKSALSFVSKFFCFYYFKCYKDKILLKNYVFRSERVFSISYIMIS